ncbi:uncharacterized protein [Parasteatoda tepidariorum]|uniref:uncharacterized protein n=1 Tax=Parasteatoda tepidariorum TaxID=114398 RepID=UPI00077F8C23|nr:uncharacterized protein LOC107456246 [Parasteatoda tepidariorum]
MVENLFRWLPSGSAGECGAGVFCHLFSACASVGYSASAYDGEIEAILIALKQLQCRTDQFSSAAILSDSKAAALLDINSPLIPQSISFQKCIDYLKDLTLKGKQIVLQWIPGHCGIWGNEKADFLAKKGTTIVQASRCSISLHSFKLLVRNQFRNMLSENFRKSNIHKTWFNYILTIPNQPMFKAVVLVRLVTGRDCLAKHLFSINIFDCPKCKLCSFVDDMDLSHISACPALFSTTACGRYWEARVRMG